MGSSNLGEHDLSKTSTSITSPIDEVDHEIPPQESPPKPPTGSLPKRRPILDTSRFSVTNPKDMGDVLDPNSKAFMRAKALGWIQGKPLSTPLAGLDDETPTGTPVKADDGVEIDLQGTNSIGSSTWKAFSTDDDLEGVNSKEHMSRKKSIPEGNSGKIGLQGHNSIGRSSSHSEKGSNELESILEGINSPPFPPLQNLFYQPVKDGTFSSTDNGGRKRPALAIDTEGLEKPDDPGSDNRTENVLDPGTSSFSPTCDVQESVQSGDDKRHSKRISTSSEESDDSQTATFPFTDNSRAVQELEAIYTRMNLSDLDTEYSTSDLETNDDPLANVPIDYHNVNSQANEALMNTTTIINEALETATLPREPEERGHSFDSDAPPVFSTAPLVLPTKAQRKKDKKKAAKARRKAEAALVGGTTEDTASMSSVAVGIKNSNLELDELMKMEKESMSIERYPKSIEHQLREQTGTETVWYSPSDRFPRHPTHAKTWTQKNLWCTTCIDYCPICCNPCCAFMGATHRLATLENSSEMKNINSLGYDTAKEFLKQCEKWIGTGLDPMTFIQCSDCERWCCPECMGICPNEICKDRTCVTCKPGRFEECDWHQA
ncbi:MAG: hypothetical protein MMC33_008437 [Icmadophila ericetorum]|nr:hypothetical protein [Icmadophila ericetorum]